MSKNNQKNYDPNYFLASLGNGGLVVTFFMYLMFMIKHPETPMPTFEDILPVLTGTNLVAKISTILVLLGIAYFVFNNIYYLIWNIKKYMNFRLSPEFTKLKSSNAEVTLMSIPLALAMSVNALIVAGVAAPIRVKNSQPFQKAYILEHSFFTSHNLDFIVLERIKMMYGIMR